MFQVVTIQMVDDLKQERRDERELTAFDVSKCIIRDCHIEVYLFVSGIFRGQSGNIVNKVRTAKRVSNK